MNIKVIKGQLWEQVQKEAYAYLAKVLIEQYQKVKEAEKTTKKVS
jgi:hypothetical protein